MSRSLRLAFAAAVAMLVALPAGAQMRALSDPVVPHPDPESLFTSKDKGIDPKLHTEIFRPGYSTKKRGWGLGLSLSKRIIEDYHRGKLFVKASAPGEGTTFRIRLRK